MLHNLKLLELSKEDGIDDFLEIGKTYNPSDVEIASTINASEIELAEAGGNRRIFIAYKENQPIAMVQLLLINADNDPELANAKDICHVHNLRVSFDCQKMGIGKFMMDFIEEEAMKIHQKIITLGVESDNARALKLYNARGYKIFKEIEGRYPGEICFYMKKHL